MPITISDGITTLEAILLADYSTERISQNVVHTVLNAVPPAVTHRPTTLRSGRLSLMVETYAAALDLEELLSLPKTFTLTDSEPGRSMSFVLQENGKLTVSLDSKTRNAWLVGFDFQEVA